MGEEEGDGSLQLVGEDEEEPCQARQTMAPAMCWRV